ncbi:hypothetical protein Micbo1qcDRAFT_195677 [Microdochium bolleyi]|uniref:G-patch domain-containing protein n=1 Tax=Microdochium bolleyi TaxID=196109 RepID=A0A136J0Q6_9PEZI|nr:hypothetical protein Micbo1qcDRAFT_195677 [Microdochium bolleyi]
MPDQGPKPARAGLSLYANLLGPSGGSASTDEASISRAPVVSREALEAIKDQEAGSAKRPAIDAALRFQPLHQIRRPQQKTQKPKAFPKAPGTATNASTASAAPSNASVAPPIGDSSVTSDTAPPAPTATTTQKPTLADWQATQEEDEWVYGTGDKRPRGGRRKKKGGRGRGDDAPAETNWDEIYDPSRPTNVEEYLRSDERVREVQEWKALLYRHRRQQQQQRRRSRSKSWSSDEEMEDSRPQRLYNFAPPPMSPPTASIPDDNTGGDAYMRRLAMSQNTAAPPLPTETQPPPPPSSSSSSLPPHPSSLPLQPPGDPATISRAPVRYTPSEQPPPPPQQRGEQDPDAMETDGPPTTDENGEEQPRSSRPGQKGFAARLMAKYGWSKGQGLGAESSGIVQPIRVQVEKRKKNEDSGSSTPGGARGKIIAPKRAASAAQQQSSSSASASAPDSKFGRTSNVIVLRSMLEGMADLQSEIEDGLGQEIGEECGDKYGRVERLYIDIEGKRVYIKFTDGVSALRAVNALDGRIFAGNTIIPQFYDLEKFEQRIYD